jgi:hypothetical protein
MFRRVVSLILLPCVLLTQSAALLGHAHAGLRLPGHDLRPHFHTQPTPVGHQNDHGQHHHGHGPGSHNHDVADVVATNPPSTPPTQHPEPLPDHDSDAVYVIVTDAVVVERSQPTTQVESSDCWSFPDLAPFATFKAEPPTHPLVCGHPPPGHLCPLYIRHLALLI